jgi:uncharacterized protein YggE
MPPREAAGHAPVHQRTVIVTGRGEVARRPDLAVLRLGAVAQAETASEAHGRVNEAVAASIERIKGLGVPAENISTAGLAIYPVYAEQQPRREPVEPRIAGYRASQTIRVELDDLGLVGRVIDSSVQSGANQFESLSFELRDDSEARRDSLQRAAQQARSKAQAIAEALGVSLGDLHRAEESGAVVPVIHREFAGRAAMAMDAAGTPVEPWQVRVEASVTLTYLIGPGSGGAAR